MPNIKIILLTGTFFLHAVSAQAQSATWDGYDYDNNEASLINKEIKDINNDITDKKDDIKKLQDRQKELEKSIQAKQSEKEWLTLAAIGGNPGMRIKSRCTYKPRHGRFAPVYRGRKHDRTMTQLQSFNPKRKNMPRERWYSM